MKKGSLRLPCDANRLKLTSWPEQFLQPFLLLLVMLLGGLGGLGRISRVDRCIAATAEKVTAANRAAIRAAIASFIQYSP